MFLTHALAGNSPCWISKKIVRYRVVGTGVSGLLGARGMSSSVGWDAFLQHLSHWREAGSLIRWTAWAELQNPKIMTTRSKAACRKKKDLHDEDFYSCLSEGSPADGRSVSVLLEEWASATRTAVQ